MGERESCFVFVQLVRTHLARRLHHFLEHLAGPHTVYGYIAKAKADTPSAPVRATERTGGIKINEKKERKKTDNPREGWEDGTPPPHRDFKEISQRDSQTLCV